MAKRPAKPAPEELLIDAALALAAETPWARVGLDDIAAKADVSIADAYAAFPCRASLVAAVIARHDKAMLAGDDPSLAEESRRDRLFDAIMRRLEAMRPHRPALRSMIRGAPADPGSMLAGGSRLCVSLAWMLRAAGISPDGLFGFLRVKALGLVYLATLRAFLKDESDDLAHTMAALDKALKRAGGTFAG